MPPSSGGRGKVALGSCRVPHATVLLTWRPLSVCRDITVEFWARTPAYTPRNATPERYAEFFSFASFGRDGGGLLREGCGRQHGSEAC